MCLKESPRAVRLDVDENSVNPEVAFLVPEQPIPHAFHLVVIQSRFDVERAWFVDEILHSTFLLGCNRELGCAIPDWCLLSGRRPLVPNVIPVVARFCNLDHHCMRLIVVVI